MSRTLVELAQQGDRDAYERLARDVSRRLFLVASRILRDTDAAEDAVQQTLVAIWRDLGSLKDLDRFEAWTYRILVRYCWAERRRHRRMHVELVDISDSMAARDDAISAVDERDQIGRAFDRLSKDHRVVVVLHHMLGMPLAEIAEVLDIPYGTVGSRLHHATKAMRAALSATANAQVTEGQLA